MGTAQVVRKDNFGPCGFRWLTLKRITYKDQTGRLRFWESAERLSRHGAVDGVAIVAVVTSKGEEDQIILESQFRPSQGSYVIEFPAGLIDAEEDAATAALRELREETGYTGTVVEVSPVCYSDPGMSNANMQFAVVRVNAGAPENAAVSPELEEGEFIEVFLLPVRGLYDALLAKQRETGWDIDARLLMYADALRRGAGLLPSGAANPGPAGSGPARPPEPNQDAGPGPGGEGPNAPSPTGAGERSKDGGSGGSGGSGAGYGGAGSGVGRGTGSAGGVRDDLEAAQGGGGSAGGGDAAAGSSADLHHEGSSTGTNLVSAAAAELSTKGLPNGGPAGPSASTGTCQPISSSAALQSRVCAAGGLSQGVTEGKAAATAAPGDRPGACHSVSTAAAAPLSVASVPPSAACQPMEQSTEAPLVGVSAQPCEEQALAAGQVCGVDPLAATSVPAAVSSSSATQAGCNGLLNSTGCPAPNGMPATAGVAAGAAQQDADRCQSVGSGNNAAPGSGRALQGLSANGTPAAAAPVAAAEPASAAGCAIGACTAINTSTAALSMGTGGKSAASAPAGEAQPVTSIAALDVNPDGKSAASAPAGGAEPISALAWASRWVMGLGLGQEVLERRAAEACADSQQSLAARLGFSSERFAEGFVYGSACAAAAALVACQLYVGWAGRSRRI